MKEVSDYKIIGNIIVDLGTLRLGMDQHYTAILSLLDDNYKYCLVAYFPPDIKLAGPFHFTRDLFILQNFLNFTESVTNNGCCDEEIALDSDLVEFFLMARHNNDNSPPFTRHVGFIPNNILKGSYNRGVKGYNSMYRFNHNVNPFVKSPLVELDFLDSFKKSRNIRRRGMSTVPVNRTINMYNKLFPQFTAIMQNPESDKYQLQLDIETSFSNEVSARNTLFTNPVDGVTKDVFHPIVRQHILDNIESLDLYLNNLTFDSVTGPTDRSKLIRTIFSVVHSDKRVLKGEDLPFLLNLTIMSYIRIICQENINDNMENNVTKFGISVGKMILRRYLLNMKAKDIINNIVEPDITYSNWYKSWCDRNISESDLYNVQLEATLGVKLLEILESRELIRKEHVTIDGGYKPYYFICNDDEIIKLCSGNRVLGQSGSLPMIVPPKLHGENKLGGYLLNDVSYSESMIIPKSNYRDPSTLTAGSKLHYMINKMAQTPFKINKDLLDFIMEDSLGLLIDTGIKPPYHDVPKRTKMQDKAYKGFISNLHVQENILSIADFFSNVPKLYFPIRCDQRGRIYPKTDYFNYQSTDLAKSLLLFAEPSVVSRKNPNIKYFEGYGANCFGGPISKKDVDVKVKWVRDNIHDILNFENGILVGKAKDKFLFLAFCFEYKRYWKFLHNEDLYSFKTYFPVQLDATCNGFQHMALISQESDLFKSLNLVNGDSSPNDFYSFLLHKMELVVSDKHSKGIEFAVKPLEEEDDIALSDEYADAHLVPKAKVKVKVKTKPTSVRGKKLKNLKSFLKTEIVPVEELPSHKKGSYYRLKDFIWDRSLVKKAIMTMPYNSTKITQIKYIKESLSSIVIDDVWWYFDPEVPDCKLSHSDILLMVTIMNDIIYGDFEKIKKLSSYLKNVAKILVMLSLPIIWSLANGLVVSQSYLKVKTTTISPFSYRKTKLNLNVVTNKLDLKKMITALMPNLIHSLDANSLSLLYYDLSMRYHNFQFYSVHDCFGVTFDKIIDLKQTLAAVYTDIYLNDQFLLKFDKDILDLIEKSGYSINRETREIDFENKTYKLHDINWVLNKVFVDDKVIKKINDQYIVI